MLINWKKEEKKYQITGVWKKSESVTRADRNANFFYTRRSLFLEYELKRFQQKQVVKWSFSKLKEEHLIGKRLFLLGFCWKFNLGKFFTLIYSETFIEKTKNHTPKCQKHWALSNGTLLASLYAPQWEYSTGNLNTFYSNTQ